MRGIDLHQLSNKDETSLLKIKFTYLWNKDEGRKAIYLLPPIVRVGQSSTV